MKTVRTFRLSDEEYCGLKEALISMRSGVDGFKETNGLKSDSTALVEAIEQKEKYRMAFETAVRELEEAREANKKLIGEVMVLNATGGTERQSAYIAVLLEKIAKLEGAGQKGEWEQ